jgi:hypothetical protein
MKYTLPLSLLALASLGLVIVPGARAQVPYISTYSIFGRDTSGGFVADAYNAYDTASGATNINSNRPNATATGSAIYTNTLYDSAPVEAMASTVAGGFYVSKNYAKISVTNVQDSGYIAGGVYGSHTQLKFLTAPNNAAYSVFRWNVSGSTLTSPDTGYAGAVLRFMAGYYPTETYNSVFNTATPPADLMVFENTGNFVYNLPITLGQNIDLFYQATASVKLSRDEAQDLLGDTYTAEADFASTTILDRIDLYDSSNNLITSNWSLGDVETGQARFDQNGRVNSTSSTPEPGTLAFVALGGTLVLIKRRKY